MVKIILNNNYAQIKDLDDQSVISALDEHLSFFVQGANFTKAFQKGYWNRKLGKFTKWDGKNHLLGKDLKFRIGLLDRVKAFFKKCGVDCQIADKRPYITFGPKLSLKNVQSRDYQDRIHEACLKNMSGIVKSCTGSGKSISMARLVADTNIKTNIYVPGIDLLYQLQDMFAKVGIKAGIIGDGRAEVKKINIVSIWTACAAFNKKYEAMDDEDYLAKQDKISEANKAKVAKAIRAAQMCLYDECHMVATQTIKNISSESHAAKYVFGFSGTPWRDDQRDMEIEEICGSTIVEVTASELIKKKWLVPPKIHMLEVPEYTGKSDRYHSIYKEYIVENEERNNLVVKSAVKLFKSGRKVLILVKNIKHGEILLSMMPDDLVVYFIKGNVKSEDRNEIRQEFIDGGIDILIATVIYDQGIDITSLDSLILAGGGKSSGRTLQRIGRVIRKHSGKKDAIVIDFIDNAKYLLKHTAARIKTFKIEPGFSIKLPRNMKDANKKIKKASAQRLQKFERW